MAKRLTQREQRSRDLRRLLDSRDFYEVAQTYRHTPAQKPQEVVDAFEALKTFVMNESKWIR